MPEQLRATIGQLSTADGRWQPRAANVRAVEPAPDLPAAGRGHLYILIEISGSGGGHSALYRQLLNAAQTAYYELGETVDSALRMAVRKVHMELRQANEALPEADWRGGISLVVRMNDQVVIGQAGPALVLIGHEDRVDEIPPSGAGPALGGPERPEVVISRTRVEHGSMILLLQSDWPRQVSPKSLAVASYAETVPLAGEYLGTLGANAELSALMVGLRSAIPEVEEDAAKPAAAAATSVAAAEVARRSFLRRPRAATSADGAPTAVAGTPATTMLIPSSGDVAVSEEPPLPVPPVPAPQKRSNWPLIVALVIIPLMVGGLVLAMLLVRGQAVDEEFAQYMSGAETVLNEVETLPEDAAAQRIGAAREFLEKARPLKPEDPRLVEAQARFDENLARVQHVTPLYGIVPLWDFNQPSQDLDRVVTSGDSVFVQDLGRSEIHRFTRSSLGDTVTPSDKPIIRKGDMIGNQAVGDQMDMAWAEAEGANQRSKLLSLDLSGGLVGYDLTWKAERLNIAGREKWVKPNRITSYGGNLYVVDADGDQIWRYRPSGNGYEGQPEPYFANAGTVDLAGVQSVAIDGSVWLLFPDGRLLKFFAGEQRPFELRGLPEPLSSPADIAVPLESDRIYIADAGNARIIEATKDGRFLRQFRAREGDVLRDVRSLFLDEQGAMFYILTSDQLFKANLPETVAPLNPVPSDTPTQ